jgi:glycerol uptake facilitator-like aquaporin
MSNQEGIREQKGRPVGSPLAALELTRRNFDNPALEWRRLSRRSRGPSFPWRRFPGYLLAQLVGSTLACLLLLAMFGKIGMLGATEPGLGISDWQTLVMEVVLTVSVYK